MTQRNSTYGIRSIVLGVGLGLAFGFSVANWPTIDASVLAQFNMPALQNEDRVRIVWKNVQVAHDDSDDEVILKKLYRDLPPRTTTASQSTNRGRQSTE